MSKIILVTGGARSGKSTLAEKLTKEIGKNIVYIATSIITDDDMQDRVNKHKQSRPEEWTTIERFSNFNEMIGYNDFLNSDTVLLDCMTIMVTNLLFENEVDFDTCSMDIINEIEKNIFIEVKKLLNVMKENEKNIIIVTNELGMGLVPAYRLGSIFRDIAGRINQYIANEADDVYLTVSGIPVKIK